MIDEPVVIRVDDPAERVQVIRLDPADDTATLVYVPGTGAPSPGGGTGEYARPIGPAGGVLAGTYPNPGFRTNMATQEEMESTVDARVAMHRYDDLPHPVYDDMQNLTLRFLNGLV